MQTSNHMRAIKTQSTPLQSPVTGQIHVTHQGGNSFDLYNQKHLY